MRILLQVIALSLLLTPAAPARADYYIVVQNGNPQASLTQKEALYLFMGRSRTFVNGAEAKTYDIQRDEKKRAGFYQALSGMSLSQVTSYWARLMFSGRSLPPTMLPTESSMVEVLKKNPNAIGWLSKAPTDKELRTLLVLTEGP